MPVIKRYSNRKLYDTESKNYVTLEDLAEFIRQGQEVRVVDHVTGEDLTSTTLLQILFEEQKKIGGLLPQVFLTRLIRVGDLTVNTLRGRLASIDPFLIVDDEIRRRLKALLEAGKVSEQESQRIQDLLLRRPPQGDVIHIPVKVEEEEEETAPAQTQDEIVEPEVMEALLRQVNVLEEELAKLKAGTAR
jgi:polyhydroxyalkanoate synthesis repressor PhaR